VQAEAEAVILTDTAEVLSAEELLLHLLEVVKVNTQEKHTRDLVEDQEQVLQLQAVREEQAWFV
jgi:hypothetical protein